MSSPEDQNVSPVAGNEDQPEQSDENKQGEEQAGAEDSSYQPPISAIPPRVTLTEESQMEVSASPAFQCLDDVSIDVRYHWI